MSNKSNNEQAVEAGTGITKRLDAARAKYDALRQSYEKLLGRMEQMEPVAARVRVSDPSRRS